MKEREKDGERELRKKYQQLKNILSELESAAVAFSGGVDSTFLLSTTREILKDRVVSFTVSAPIISRRELEDVSELIRKIPVRHEFLKVSSLDDPEFTANTPQRCYVCKKKIFSVIREAARKRGISVVLDGSNADDTGDYRPGMRALREMGIRSPLREAGLTKEDIRMLSRERNLPTWNKPALACLASRIPYETEITAEKLTQVDEAEGFLLKLGFSQVRVRHHGSVARIEILPSEWLKLNDEPLRRKIYTRLKEFGFEYAALDLLGYRTGSLNEGLIEPVS